MRHAVILLLTSVFLFGEFAFGSQAVAAETVCENTERKRQILRAAFTLFQLF